MRLATVVAALLFATQAHAASITIYTDRATFDAAVGPTVVEDFDSILVQSPFHTVPLDVGDFTLSMTGSPLTSYNFIDLPPLSPLTDVNGTTNMRVHTTKPMTLVFTFDAPTTVFGGDFQDVNGVGIEFIHRTRIDVEGDALLFPLPSGGVTFFGFESDTPFTTVTFIGIRNDVYGIDNVTFSDAVPEPTSGLLLGLGCLGLGVAARRRRRRKTIRTSPRTAPA